MNIDTRVSLVIPVYNEVDRIHDCLVAIAAQSIRPFEVLVVDNNSTDQTAAIASSFPFVRLLQEPRQGVVYARDRGFNAARGSIIARIDADTIIATDWIQQLTELFARTDCDVVTGSVTYRDIALPKIVSRLDLFWRRRLARQLGRDVAVQGANMALRRSIWQSIARSVCHRRDIHEDFDIAIHANRVGANVSFEEALTASICYRQANYSFSSFCEYVLVSPRTYLNHGVKSGRHMYEVVALVITLYPIISLLSRGYDQQLGRWSFSKLFLSSVPPRVNPATFVD